VQEHVHCRPDLLFPSASCLTKNWPFRTREAVITSEMRISQSSNHSLFLVSLRHMTRRTVTMTANAQLDAKSAAISACLFALRSVPGGGSPRGCIGELVRALEQRRTVQSRRVDSILSLLSLELCTLWTSIRRVRNHDDIKGLDA